MKYLKRCFCCETAKSPFFIGLSSSVPTMHLLGEICRGDRGNGRGLFWNHTAEQMRLQQLNELRSSGCCSQRRPDAPRPAVPSAPGAAEEAGRFPQEVQGSWMDVQGPGGRLTWPTSRPPFPGWKNGKAELWQGEKSALLSSQDGRLCARSHQSGRTASGLHLFYNLRPDLAPSTLGPCRVQLWLIMMLQRQVLRNPSN